MLTEIEWWGGVIFVWGVLCYRLFLKAYENKLDITSINVHITYFCSAGVLALYFYPLESRLLQIIFMLLLAIAITSILIAFFISDEEEDAEEEESGVLLGLLSTAIFMGPTIIASVLGLIRSAKLVQNFI